MSSLTLAKRILSPLVLYLLLTGLAFGQTSASLSGVVQDTQGAVVAGAKVTLTEPTKSIKLETVTNTDGLFSFPALQPGNYTVTVEMQGFKQFSKSGIILETLDKKSTGVLTLEVGELTSTVEVTAEIGQLQLKTESGEQSEVITGRQVRELAINGRNYLDLVKLVPGVVSTGNYQIAGPGGFGSISINGTRTNQHNLTIDGSTNVDTGSNGTQHVALNLDTIAEFKVLTSNYQAEYGRSGGGDIKITTRGGTNEFHGTGYLFHRHEGLNANSFFNNAEGVLPSGVQRNQRPLYRYNYFGYNVGGPIKLPKNALKDRLFFFFGQDWAEQLVPANARQVRVPTAAELNGDFSNTRDGNGNPIIIRDPATGQPFPGNRILADRFNASGLAILRLFNKFDNSPSNLPLFNHNSQQSSGYPRRQYNIRVDYNLTDSTRIFGRYTQDNDKQILPYGVGWTSGQNFPLTPTIFKQGPAKNATLNVTTVLSPTMTNEFVFGPSQNNLTLDPTEPNAATFSGIGLRFQPPFPYPSNQFINVEFQSIPGISNDNIGRINSYSQFPYKNSNTTFDFYDNFSKVWGPHSTKTGIYVHRSRKDQAAGNSMRIIFSNNVNNPGNTGHPYANALLGNFDSYQQPTRGIYQGQYRSTNVEWYVQDNWRVNKRLTLDYGLRFAYIGPQYDARNQDAYFDPTAWDPSKAVRLYRRDVSGQAVDPANPSVLLPSFLVGRIVPGSGDPFNGMRTTASGFFRGGFEARAPQLGPSFGFAYDVFGNSKTVLRGGYRIGYDRVSGNTTIFPAVEQPPTFVNPRFDFGNLDTVGASTGQIALAPVDVRAIDTSGKIPGVQSFSLQIQQELGFETVVSIGYVGSLSSHLWQRMNLNYIPYGTTFQRQSQDPSNSVFPGGVIPDIEPNLPQVYAEAGLRFSGRYALERNFLARYPGYRDVAFSGPMGSANYHSMQVTMQRRFSRGLTYGLAYTWSKAMDTANGDQDFTNPICARCYDYRRASFDRTHNLAINYVWNLPRLSPRLGDHWLAKGIFDNWELSGISQFISGQPEEVSIGIPDVNLNQRITGSWTEGSRVLLTKDPQPSRSRETWFDYTAFRLPDVGTQGLGNRQYLTRPGINATDVSIFKNFPFGGEGARFLQFRVEMFNAFNHPVFHDMNRTLTFNINSNFSNYRENQQASASSLRNLRGGANSPATGRLGRAVGEVSGQPDFVARSRVIQLAVKLYF